MAIQVVRLGSERRKHEAMRLGTVRRPPRGVNKNDYARLNFYDVWLPELAPTRELVAWAQEQPFTSARWSTFRRRYLAEMRQPAQQHLIALLAKLSQAADISVGCYCVDETRCHRSVLKELLTKAGAEII